MAVSIDSSIRCDPSGCFARSSILMVGRAAVIASRSARNRARSTGSTVIVVLAGANSCSAPCPCSGSRPVDETVAIVRSCRVTHSVCVATIARSCASARATPPRCDAAGDVAADASPDPSPLVEDPGLDPLLDPRRPVGQPCSARGRTAAARRESRALDESCAVLGSTEDRPHAGSSNFGRPHSHVAAVGLVDESVPVLQGLARDPLGLRFDDRLSNASRSRKAASARLAR